MARKRTTRKRKRSEVVPMPRYDFPRLGSLLLALIILALIAVVGTTVAGTPVVQEMAHSEVQQMVP